MSIKEFIYRRIYYLITPNDYVPIDVDAFIRQPTIFDIVIFPIGLILLYCDRGMRK
jgi:hypothetical protein